MDWDDAVLSLCSQVTDGFVVGAVIAFIFEDKEDGSMVMVNRTKGIRSTEMLGLGRVIQRYAEDELFPSELEDE